MRCLKDKKSPLNRVIFGFLYSALITLTPNIVRAYVDVQPVSASNAPGYCSDENTAPWASGSQLATPGFWVRPGNKGGSSWDLVWDSNRRNLKIILYTYEYRGRPIWFMTDTKPLLSDGTSWTATLYQYAAPGVSRSAVGSVAIRFFPNDPTRLVATWDWDGLHSNGVSTTKQTECLGNFIEVSPTFATTDLAPAIDGASDAPQSTGSTGGAADNLVNQLFSGYWSQNGATSADAAPGFVIHVLQSTYPSAPGATAGTFQETEILLSFDANGLPVWLYGDMESPSCSGMPCRQMPNSDVSGNLLYYQPNPSRYPAGVPLESCTDACVVSQSVATIVRSVTDGQAGTKGKFKVTGLRNPPSNIFGGSTPGQVLVSSNFYPSVGVGSNIKKILGGSTGIQPVQYSCKASSWASTATCPIWVAWNTTAGTPWRRSLQDGTRRQLSTASNGEVIDAVHAGEHVVYELWDGLGVNATTPSGNLIDQSAEVRGYGPKLGNGDSGSVTAPVNPATPSAPAAFAEPALDVASDLIGAISADFRVDEGGNATYRIPLLAPPGAGGFAPTLALTYNSGVGMGYFGTGVSLEGTSSIVPCRPGKEFGDTGEPTALASAFCLDGQRLLLQSGGDRTVGAEYRTEVESFRRVKIVDASVLAVGTKSVKTFTFSVSNKDGSKQILGGAAGTVVSSCPSCNAGSLLAPVAWLEATRSDAANNTIDYGYSPISDSGERYLQTVSYVGGEIVFNYGIGSGVDTSYSRVPVEASSILARVQRSKIATSIDVKSVIGATTAPLRHYQMTYQDPIGMGTAGAVRARLTEIKECAGSDGSNCYEPTIFTWADPSLQVLRSGNESFGGLYNLRAQKFGDFNGDHRTDILWVDKNHNLYATYSTMSTDGTSFTNQPVLITTLSNRFREEALWEPFDLNGDGRDDVLYAQVDLIGGISTLQWYVSYALSYTNGFAAGVPIAGVQQQVVGSVLGSPDAGSTPGSIGTAPGIILQGSSMLSDFDGDGLPDLLFIGPGALQYSIALMKTGGQAYAFSAAVPVTFKRNDGSMCSLSSETLGKEKWSKTDAVDLDGDGRGDLHFVLRQDSPCLQGTALPVDPGQTVPQSPGAGDPMPAELHNFYLSTFSARGIQGGAFVFQKFDWMEGVIPFRDTTAGSVYGRFRIIDLNGDGIMDVAFRGDFDDYSDHAWRYRLAGDAKGSFRCIVDCLLWSEEGDGSAGSMAVDDQVQFVDFDGDGKMDFLYPSNGSRNGDNFYTVHLWQGNGFSSSFVTTGFNCGGSSDWSRTFMDFDGDGIPDLLTRKNVDDSVGFVAQRVGNHHTPRNIITKIVNGLNAVTKIAYAPLTFASVYHRDYDAPWVISNGRGSPVFDVTAPRTVAQYVSSSAPTVGNPGDEAVIQYFYAGLKMQAGGRGMLGFRRVSSYDHQSGVETDTYYSTLYPTTGTATRSVTRYVPTLPGDPCMGGGADGPACIVRTAQCSTGLNSTCDTDLPTALRTLRTVTDSWGWRVQPNVLNDHHWTTLNNGALPAATASSAVRPNVFVARTVSVMTSADLIGVPMSGESTIFDTTQFDDFGNPGASIVTKTGGVTLTTQSTFTYSNDVTNWRLGRLLTAQVLNQRAGVSNARRSTFAYDPITKLLASETVEGMTGTAIESLSIDTTARTVVKYYVHDDFGNVTGTYTCSAEIPDSTCKGLTGGSANYIFHPATDGRGITRYSTTDYDSGIFPRKVHEGFSNGGSASIDRIVSEVQARNSGGDPTKIVDANGITTQIRYGVMGRKRYTWASTGAWSRVDYAACTPSTCPANMALAYVSTTTTAGAPMAKVFYDILGRQAIQVSTGFSGEVIAAQTQYDDRGNVVRRSQPYIAADAGKNAASVKSGTAAITWTTTHFDTLNRPDTVTQPDGGVVSKAYAGLQTTTTLPANDNGQVQTQVQVRDGVGNIISTTDANGLTVTYTYDGYGQLTDVTHNGQVTHTVYDTLGRKTSMTDPDAGTWTYVVDDLGQTIQQRSPRGTCARTQYDARGRLWQRLDYATPDCSGNADTTSQWDYDTLSYGVGALAQEVTNTMVGVNSVQKVLRTPTYDGYGRPIKVNTVQDNKTYVSQSSYDQYGRTFQKFFTAPGYPTTGELYEYNANGYQSTIRSAYPGTTGQVYYQTLAMDAFGHVTQEVRGAQTQIETNRTYDPQTGRLVRIVTDGGLAQDQSYAYDKLGNVTQRADRTQPPDFGVPARAVVEQFYYDKLQRLTSSTLTTGSTLTPPSLTMSYGDDGNVTSKGVAGSATQSYAYGKTPAAWCASHATGYAASGPHAVTQAGSDSYCYDANGNVIRASAGDRTITYTPYDLPAALTSVSNNIKVGFEYGPNREKIRRLNYPSTTATNSTDVVHYVGDAEIHVNALGIQEVRRYAGPVIVVQSDSGGQYQIGRQYPLTDGQGSTFAVLSDWGEPLSAHASMAFDPFGARREADSAQATPWTPVLQAELDATTRHGYTGHEQVDAAGVIHMNGRIYDPVLGRFLQADPYVQDMFNSQSLNRYSYVLNNPLAYTDPTGYWGHREQGYVRMAAAIVISVWTGGMAAGAATWGEAAAWATAGGFASGMVASGNGKGAVMGGLTSLAFLGVNYAVVGGDLNALKAGGLSTKQYAARALTSGVAGGVLASIQGQRFGSGFLSAGLGAALNPAVEGITSDPYGQGFIAAIVGGTVSEASGGKFANGAVTGAFSYAMGRAVTSTMRAPNDSQGSTLAQPGNGMPPGPEAGELAYVRSLAPELDGETLKDRWEFATEIYHSSEGYDDTNLNTLESPFGSRGTLVSAMGTHVSSLHSHPPAGLYRVNSNDLEIVGFGHKVGEMLKVDPMHFSPADVRNMQVENLPGWVVPAGTDKLLYFPINNPKAIHYEYYWK